MRDELRIITMRLRGQLDREIAEARDEAEYPVGDEPEDIPDTVNPVSGEVE